MTSRRGFLGFLAAAGITAVTGVPAPAAAITVPAPPKAWEPQPGDSYESYTFRRAPGWFDIITYTGLGTGAYTLQNTLQKEGGVVIIKNTSTAQSWHVLEMGRETVTLPPELNQPGDRYMAYEFGPEALADPRIAQMIEKFKQVPGVVVL